MNDKEIMSLLTLVAKALQTDYKSKAECKQALTNCLIEVNKAAISISGKPVVRNKLNVIEAIATGKAWI